MKKYSSKKTRKKHTYKFYKDRKNDPQWRDAYLIARKKRKKIIIFSTSMLMLIFCLSWISYNYGFNKSSSNYSNIKQDSKSKEKKQSKPSKKSKDTSTSEDTPVKSSNSDNNRELINSFLKSGFEIIPVSYSGDNTEIFPDRYVFDSNGNLSSFYIDIYSLKGYLKDNNTLRLMDSKATYDKSFFIENNVLIIGKFKFPFSIENNHLVFYNTTYNNDEAESNDNSNNISNVFDPQASYKIISNSSAKEAVDSTQSQY